MSGDPQFLLRAINARIKGILPEYQIQFLFYDYKQDNLHVNFSLPVYVLFDCFYTLFKKIFQKNIVSSYLKLNSKISPLANDAKIEITLTLPDMSRIPKFEFYHHAILDHEVEIGIEYGMNGAIVRKRFIRYPSHFSAIYLRNYVQYNLTELIYGDIQTIHLDASVEISQSHRLDFDKSNEWKKTFELVFNYIKSKIRARNSIIKNWSIFLISRRDGNQIHFEIPNYHWFADPFLYKSDKNNYLFFEDFDVLKNRGSISFLHIEDGSHHECIKEDFHISFPILFSDAGTIYMSVESVALGGVLVYKCIRFPDTWEKYLHILPSEHLVDPILFKRNGSWNLLATRKSFYGNDYYSHFVLFTNAGLQDYGWVPFPVYPLFIDSFIGRNGGFIESHDKSFRFAQKFKSGSYGVDLSERMVFIDTKLFRELSSDSFKMAKPSHVKNFHTYTINANFIAYDFKPS